MAESTRTMSAGDRGSARDANDTPTQQLALSTTGDRCVNCGAPLASDQRYCITCGERRGKPRFALAEPTETTTQTVTTTRSLASRRPRTSAGFNLIAGVATLLLAMGVGVLIGHNSSPAQSGKTTTQVVNLGSAGTDTGSAAAANPGGSSGSSSAKSHRAKSNHAHAAAAKAPPKVVVEKAAAAASKVTGGSAQVASPTATQGSACANGTAGCQNGKFTGNNFFGQ